LSALTGKFNQNRVNYAKQTQFPKKSNVYNRNYDNELQWKIDNGHLVKTNPNKPNFIRRSLLVRHSFSDGGGEGGFKMS
jgi:hypothetical protein